MQILAQTDIPDTQWNQWIIDHLAVEEPIGILAILLMVLASLFWFAQRSAGKRLFGIIPMLVFCYFVPTTLNTIGILPDLSPVYSWVKTYLLPCSLLLLIIALDVPGIIRLGPKAGIMLLAGTLGIVIGGPIALFVGQLFLPVGQPVPFVLQNDEVIAMRATDEGQSTPSLEDVDRNIWELPSDTWRGMTALAGSWIGGGANYVALGKTAYAELPAPQDPDGETLALSEEQLTAYREKQESEMLGLMVIVDVGVANIWMGILLFSAGHQRRIDKWSGADTSSIDELKTRLIAFEKKVTRVPSLADIMMILAFGFAGAWLSFIGGQWLAETIVIENGGLAFHVTNAQKAAASLDTTAALSATTWKFILVTTLGIGLSYTRARNLEGAGASKIGSAMLYLLIACIGAGASFTKVAEAPGLIIVGAIWLFIHIVIMLVVGKLIKAPMFFIAVGSQSNIGGAASAPVVASAFHPALAPVGALLAVAGYVLGTYAGLLCMVMLKFVAGAG
ncbi:MAG: DUF819 family protein [Planctomycetota bacterium]|nr:DUF819 family protein [Planctomycetota bacterium]